jgi:hypothetical protein
MGEHNGGRPQDTSHAMLLEGKAHHRQSNLRPCFTISTFDLVIVFAGSIGLALVDPGFSTPKGHRVFPERHVLSNHQKRLLLIGNFRSYHEGSAITSHDVAA